MEPKTQEKAPTSNNYGDPEYWEHRYQKSRGQRFDWLEDFSTCFAAIQKHLDYNKQAKILNIGCGNGQIQDDLYEAGYVFTVNNDISVACIEEMQKIKIDKKYDQMVYEVMDVRQMTYGNQSFQMVLDKSTIDALMCSEDPLISVCKMIEEVYRVLKSNGIYLIVSYASPTFRLQNLKREHVNFDIQISQMKKKNAEGNELVHYLYICKKLPMKDFTSEQKSEFYHKIKQLQDIEYPPF